MRQLNVPVSERDRIRGPTDAPVTLVEYGDYQCLRCRQAHGIIKELQRQQCSRLCFVFRYFPLTVIHSYAQYAAEVAEAAAAQGRFWEMHDYLFEQQLALGNCNILQYAANLGLDLDRFEREIAEHVYGDRIQQDLSSGISSGVNGTPTFFINGIRYDGGWSLNALLGAIEKACSQRRK